MSTKRQPMDPDDRVLVWLILGMFFILGGIPVICYTVYSIIELFAS